MNLYLVAKKNEVGNYQTMFIAGRIKAGDITMPQEDGDLRDALEGGIRTLDSMPEAQWVEVLEEYRISRK